MPRFAMSFSGRAAISAMHWRRLQQIRTPRDVSFAENQAAAPPVAVPSLLPASRKPAPMVLLTSVRAVRSHRCNAHTYMYSDHIPPLHKTFNLGGHSQMDTYTRHASNPS